MLIYIEGRTDDDPALFITLDAPHAQFVAEEAPESLEAFIQSIRAIRGFGL